MRVFRKNIIRVLKNTEDIRFWIFPAMLIMAALTGDSLAARREAPFAASFSPDAFALTFETPQPTGAVPGDNPLGTFKSSRAVFAFNGPATYIMIERMRSVRKTRALLNLIAELDRTNDALIREKRQTERNFSRTAPKRRPNRRSELFAGRPLRLQKATTRVSAVFSSGQANIARKTYGGGLPRTSRRDSDRRVTGVASLILQDYYSIRNGYIRKSARTTSFLTAFSSCPFQNNGEPFRPSHHLPHFYNARTYPSAAQRILS